MPKGSKEIHVFVERHRHPIAVFLRDDWEKTQLEYVNPNNTSTDDLCEWCDKHNIKYQVLYPSVIKDITRNPFMYHKYRKMIENMGKELSDNSDTIYDLRS
jgi:hypothetical protein